MIGLGYIMTLRQYSMFMSIKESCRGEVDKVDRVVGCIPFQRRAVQDKLYRLCDNFLFG